jgi:hypothetical protein
VASPKQVSLGKILFPNQHGIIPSLKYPEGVVTPIIQSQSPVTYVVDKVPVASQEFQKKFKKVTGMSIDDSILLYEAQTGDSLTTKEVETLFTDPDAAKKMLMNNEMLHKEYRSILNNNGPQTIADAKKRGFKKLPVHKSVFHSPWYKPWKNSKWVGPDGHLETVFDPEGNLVTSTKYLGTFNFFGPDQASAHKKADVDPYFKWGN